MVSITRGLFPAVSDLARELRYRCFDQPLFEKARKQIYAAAESHLDYLAANPEATDRHQRVRALVECPQPLASVLASRFAASPPSLQQLMLEVIISRYYCVRPLSNFRTLSTDGHCCVSAQYDENGKHVHVLATQLSITGSREPCGRRLFSSGKSQRR